MNIALTNDLTGSRENKFRNVALKYHSGVVRLRREVTYGLRELEYCRKAQT
jgi:hypothetical protein